MALRISGRAITSDMTPETAHLVPGPDGGAWALSWLPGWDLTREQAIDGMALDEMLSDPAAVDAELAMELAALRAESLGMGLEDVVVRLCARVIERDRMRRRQAGDGRSAAGSAGRPGRGKVVTQRVRRYLGGVVIALLWAGYARRCARSEAMR
ncbi:hypothetical protein [Nocardia seriolae]|uniref:Uncharacterized protein n=1 Tax=Nocardia seriolae TaxID=37332 RepID=A0ABC9Z1F5_9NOCA|nr:hypothetical protein [Nocardia seriolae]BEK94856.1 hypothetical protein NSER024013_27620 [Nocardia seriolae]GAM49499.1 hypothetical protein NS07_v2contig00110-0009 [Nocardia seriolae]GAP31502.1 hypothetical protein NSK11_contig00116-0029 [Nocardia seriolae]